MSSNDTATIQRLNELVQRRRDGSLSRRTFFKATAALGLSVPLATAFERGTMAALQDAPEGQLNIAMQRVLVSLDPHGAQSVEEPTAVIATHIFGTLLTRDGATGELVPSLATDWVADGSTWTFNLREGVTWQDGTPFTSADVQNSLQRVIDLEGPLAPLWATVTEIATAGRSDRHHHHQRPAWYRSGQRHAALHHPGRGLQRRRVLRQSGRPRTLCLLFLGARLADRAGRQRQLLGRAGVGRHARLPGYPGNRRQGDRHRNR